MRKNSNAQSVQPLRCGRIPGFGARPCLRSLLLACCVMLLPLSGRAHMPYLSSVFGEWTNAVDAVLVGDFLVLSTATESENGYLNVYDVSDVNAPVFIEQNEQHLALGVSASGDAVYAFRREGGGSAFWLNEEGQLLHFQDLAEDDEDDRVSGIEVYDNYMVVFASGTWYHYPPFFSTHYYKYSVYDIENPYSPELLDIFWYSYGDVIVESCLMGIHDGYFYFMVREWMPWIDIYEISDSDSSPVETIYLEEREYEEAFYFDAVLNGHWYYTNNDSLHIHSLSEDPLAPVYQTSVPVAMEHLRVHDGKLINKGRGYYTIPADSLRIMDVSTPLNPFIEREIPISNGSNIDLDHSQLKMTAVEGGSITLWDLTNPEDPTLELTLSGSPRNEQVVGTSGAAYVMTNSGGFSIIDLSDPESPQVVGFRETSDELLFISGQVLFTWTDSLLNVWDISDPIHPQFDHQEPVPSELGNAFGLHEVSPGLLLVKSYDNEAPLRAATVEVDGPSDLTWHLLDSDLYFSTAGEGLAYRYSNYDGENLVRIYQFEEVDNPELVSTWQAPSDIHYGYARVANVVPQRDCAVVIMVDFYHDEWNSYPVYSLFMLNLEDPTQPQVVIEEWGSWDECSPRFYDENAFGIHIDGDILSVYHTQDLTSLSQFGQMSPSGLRSVTTADSLLLVSDALGVHIYDASDGLLSSVPWDDEMGAATPTVFSLGEPYPNPFNSSVILPFALRNRSEVSIRVYDVLGRHVRLLRQGMMQPGGHRVLWRGMGDGERVLPSGSYFIEVKAEGMHSTRRVLLLK